MGDRGGAGGGAHMTLTPFWWPGTMQPLHQERVGWRVCLASRTSHQASGEGGSLQRARAAIRFMQTPWSYTMCRSLLNLLLILYLLHRAISCPSQLTEFLLLQEQQWSGGPACPPEPPLLPRPAAAGGPGPCGLRPQPLHVARRQQPHKQHQQQWGCGPPHAASSWGAASCNAPG